MCIRDSTTTAPSAAELKQMLAEYQGDIKKLFNTSGQAYRCLLYTSDAADERSSVDLGGRRIIKKKKS